MNDALESLVAKDAIAGLIHGYALAVRRERYEEVAALFVPEGTFEVRRGHPDKDDFTVQQRFETPAELVAFLLEGVGKPHPIPLIHNLMIAVEGERAAATSVMAAPIYGTTHEVMGEYFDSFEKRDDQWLFAGRIYTLYGG